MPGCSTRAGSVRVLTRSRTGLEGRPWREDVEVVEGDATSPDDLGHALDGTEVAYYLLHSMDGQGELRRHATARWRRGSRRPRPDAGIDRVVYLSGLHP